MNANDVKALIGDISSLQNGGKGLLFSVSEINDVDESADESKLAATSSVVPTPIPAFAVRYNDTIYAFKNKCGHIAVTLDFQPGHFFDEEGEMLICATHGASYAPDTGKCLGGPCHGVGLEPLKVIVENDKLYLNDESVRLINDESKIG